MGEYRKLCGKIMNATACVLDADHVGHHEYADLSAKVEANVILRVELKAVRDALADATASLVSIADLAASKVRGSVDAPQLREFCETVLASVAKTVKRK